MFTTPTFTIKLKPGSPITVLLVDGKPSCVCCETAAPTLSFESERISAVVLVAAAYYSASPLVYARINRTDFEAGGWIEDTENAPYILRIQGMGEVVSSDITTDYADPLGGPTTTSYFDVLDLVETVAPAGAAAAETSNTWTSPTTGSSLPTAVRTDRVPPVVVTLPGGGTEHTLVEIYLARFKFVIPDTYTGAYLKVLWDILETPDVGSPAISSTDHEWVWTGPGDPGDPATWKSTWFEIGLPAPSSNWRVVNGRVWTSPTGSPTTFGEQFP